MRKKIKKNILSPPEHKYNYEVVGQDFPFFFPEKNKASSAPTKRIQILP
jgi:hypothetical protein